MPYKIQSIDTFVREIPPPRMDFAIGKGKSLFPDWMRANVEVRLKLESPDGRSSIGCAADWPSFGWLDKREDVEPKQKLVELLQLIEIAKNVFLEHAEFDAVFDFWHECYVDFYDRESTADAVPLCRTFSIALFERALIDAFCRIEGLSFFDALKQDRLGFDPAKIHPDLSGFSLADNLAESPLAAVHVRHTVGPSDPISQTPANEDNWIGDGEPETLEDYVKEDGISFFKVKICGDPESDIARLKEIWTVIEEVDPTVTLDGNEAYDDVAKFAELIRRLKVELPELFDRILLIEQPENRNATYTDNNNSGEVSVKAIGRTKPLIIDEADGHLLAFRESIEAGYSGVSHKNCKGVFKSLANFLLCKKLNSDETHQPPTPSGFFLSAEDLTVMPLVSLHEDLAVVAALGLTNVEKNAHHFFYGLSHLTAAEKTAAIESHPNLYKERDEELFLNIAEGQIDISSVQCVGFGYSAVPDFDSMRPLSQWIEELVN